MNIVLTGHRPAAGGIPSLPSGYQGYKRGCLPLLQMEKVANETLSQLDPDQEHTVYCGGAPGWDQVAAVVAIKMRREGWKFRLVLAEPHANHGANWPRGSFTHHVQEFIRSHADEILVVTDEAYAPEHMSTRNEWMLQQAGQDGCLLALWSGLRGGTANCVAYAEAQGWVPADGLEPRAILNLWDGYIAHPGFSQFRENIERRLAEQIRQTMEIVFSTENGVDDPF